MQPRQIRARLIKTHDRAGLCGRRVSLENCIPFGLQRGNQPGPFSLKLGTNGFDPNFQQHVQRGM